jgi:probable 2-oxoglutarate dehydrogenase E1 component DHKTD1
LQTEEEREWFAKSFEETLQESVDEETRQAVAREMLISQTFERFLAVKFVSTKRYGGEGAESMMAFFHELYSRAAMG